MSGRVLDNSAFAGRPLLTVRSLDDLIDPGRDVPARGSIDEFFGEAGIGFIGSVKPEKTCMPARHPKLPLRILEQRVEIVIRQTVFLTEMRNRSAAGSAVKAIGGRDPQISAPIFDQVFDLLKGRRAVMNADINWFQIAACA